MSSYAEIAHRRREAHALYLGLRYLGLDIRVELDAGNPAGHRVVVEGLKSLNSAHADRLMRLVRDNEAGLIEVLTQRRCPRLRLVHQNGPPP